MVSKQAVTRTTAKRLRAILTLQKRSVNWLSERSGTPYTTLLREVKGQSPIKLDELAVYASVLNVRPSEIYTDGIVHPFKKPTAGTVGNGD